MLLSPTKGKFVQRFATVCLVTLTLLSLCLPTANLPLARAASTTTDFTPTSGTDTTSGTATALTSTDLTNLNSSNDARQVSDGNWAMTGAYSSTLYIEYSFAPTLTVSSTVTSVIITHEFRRAATLTAAKLQVYETDTSTWHDEALTLPSAANTDLSQDVDVSSYINTASDVNGLKIRFTAYRDTVVASNTTSHDFLRARVTYDPVTATPTPVTPTNTPTAFPTRSVVINEVAWAGTTSSTNDEWIELYNTTSAAISLTNWTLQIDSNTPITLTASIAANSFYLLERTSSATTNVTEDLIYTGALSNSGGTLTLRDPNGNTVDTANSNGGGWPAGDATTRATMERTSSSIADSDTNWHSNNGVTVNGLDASSNALRGTPKQTNSSAPATATATPITPTPTTVPARSVIINEVAWMGTAADSTDEWLELRNTSSTTFNLSGWSLVVDGTTVINLSGSISANGYYLLERTSDSTVSDVSADLIYSGSLSNSGGNIVLRDASGATIDTANSDGGGWPAGDTTNYATMERLTTAPDTDSNWSGNYGHVVNGKDKNGNSLRGTPKAANSNQTSTPTPTPFTRHTAVRINEVVSNPSTDWTQYGIARTPAEFIELYNTSDQPINLGGWMIDDHDGGSTPFVFSNQMIIGAHGYYELYTAGLSISLGDSGDSVRLLYPDGTVVDEISWNSASDDRSISREHAGTGAWQFDWQPTPGMPNTPHKVGSKYGAKPTPLASGIRQARTWDDGAWVTLVGWITGPFPLFGTRVIYIQDESGAGIAVYLGSGTWPPMQSGQQFKGAGYLRTRNGERELYVRNSWLYGFEATLKTLKPLNVLTREINDNTEGTLVTLSGRVTRLEANAFWLDDGSGAARIFFRSDLGFDRPAVKRGQIWQVTGIVGEFTARGSSSTGHRVLVRYENDFRLMDKRNEINDPEPTATPLPEERATPTLEPTETP